MHFWWFQDFSEICIFPWENAYFFAFRLAAENKYFIFCWFCPKTKVFMELCMFDGSQDFSEICIFPWENAYCFCWLQKMHNSIFWKILEPSKMHNLGFWTKPTKYEICIFCSQPKSKKICIFPWKNAYFWKILEPSKMHNSMKTLVFGQNQRNMKYAFSAASRKAKKYAFSHGKMHISEKSWNHQKCIIPWKPWFLDKINEIWNMHFLQPAEKQKKHAFSHGKMHISENLGTIKNAYWKCVFFACYQKRILKMHIFCVLFLRPFKNAQKPSGGDLLTYVFLIFSMRTMMQRLSESKNCQGTSHKHHKVWIEIMWLKHDFHFLTWCSRATNE